MDFVQTQAVTLERRARERADHAALLREIAYGIAAAACDDQNLQPRPCPACGQDRPSAAPTLRAPVYPFHDCTACGLVYAPRVLRPEVERKHFHKRPAARAWWSALYRDAREARDRGTAAPLAERLAALVPARGCVIDVGCGFGQLLARLAPRFDEAIGLQLDEKTARVGAELFRVDIRTTPLERLEREPATVDLVVMNQILEHVRDARPLLAAAHRLLRPRGALWIGVPHAASMGMRVLGGAHRYVATHQHVNLFSAAPLATLAERTGFGVASIRTDDALDLSAVDWALERAPSLAAPAFAADLSLRALARLSRLPSRFGLGAQLESTLIKES